MRITAAASATSSKAVKPTIRRAVIEMLVMLGSDAMLDHDVEHYNLEDPPARTIMPLALDLKLLKYV